jgi:hypothetical protein
VGYDLLAAIGFVVLTPMVVVGFVIFWVINARDHEELARIWGRYAAARGLAFEGPAGEWPNRTSPALAWRHEGAELRLATVGREARVRTRLTVRPQSALLGTLVAISEPNDAGRFRSRERPRGFATRLMNDRVTRQLRGFQQRDRIVLSYRRGRVTVEWPGGELNDARLDEARRLGEELAAAIDAQFRAAAVHHEGPARQRSPA